MVQLWFLLNSSPYFYFSLFFFPSLSCCKGRKSSKGKKNECMNDKEVIIFRENKNLHWNFLFCCLFKKIGCNYRFFLLSLTSKRNIPVSNNTFPCIVARPWRTSLRIINFVEIFFFTVWRFATRTMQLGIFLVYPFFSRHYFRMEECLHGNGV